MKSLTKVLRDYHMKRLLICLITITAYIACYGQVIIWDLGDVLFKQNRFGIARSIGLNHFAAYTLFDWKTPHIQSLFFDVLDKCGSQKSENNSPIYSPDGIPLPPIMHDWLTGKISPTHLTNSVHKRIEELDSLNFFISDREKKLVGETARALFDPYVFASHNKPIKEAVRLLKECAEVTTLDGKQHILVILSNWDSYSFDVLCEQHSHIFTMFDHIFISGDIGLAKPHNACFEKVLSVLKNEYNVDPQECYFIDDQYNNVEAAQKCGINGLWLKNGNYRELRKQLKNYGLM
jgi:FMN phosphatase YigB (HAD superfamily)